ncbi:MAG: GNAT family protein [Pirellulales bacterium]|nr:GNAT family protein [Pirellulales bacterium]
MAMTNSGFTPPPLSAGHWAVGDLWLRPPRPEDIEPLYAAVMESVNEIQPWLAWYHPGYSVDDCARWVNDVPAAWAEDRSYSFAIFDQATEALLGTIGINQLDRFNRRANLGYFVRTSTTRRGIATAATLRLARFGFAELKLQRIEIVAAVGNYASQKVALKVGATREGVARRRSHVAQQQLDTVMFSLVKEDLAGDQPITLTG